MPRSSLPRSLTDSLKKLPPQTASSLKRLRQISHVMDNAIGIPGTGIRFGLDPILGVLPGGGDVAAGLLSVYIVFEGARMGVPAPTLGRMGFNILFDVVTGLVPFVGDLVDVTWKANSKNVALLEKHMTNPTPARAADKLFAALIIVALVGLVLAMAAFSVWLVSQVWALLIGQ